MTDEEMMDHARKVYAESVAAAENLKKARERDKLSQIKVAEFSAEFNAHLARK